MVVNISLFIFSSFFCLVVRAVNSFAKQIYFDHNLSTFYSLLRHKPMIEALSERRAVVARAAPAPLCAYLHNVSFFYLHSSQSHLLCRAYCFSFPVFPYFLPHCSPLIKSAVLSHLTRYSTELEVASTVVHSTVGIIVFSSHNIKNCSLFIPLL